MIYMESKEYKNSNKIYVEVVATFSQDGRITPMSITWEDGRRFEIDSVESVCPAASRKAGGAGIRYDIRIRGEQRFIFLEESRWFVEGR